MGRVLSAFPECLTEEQKTADALAELQSQGYNVPSYPEEAKTDAEKAIKAKYGKILGSAVNPVLREGNSDRRAAIPVKEYAKRYPHSMGKWESSSGTHVSSMTEGDFYANEKSVCIDAPCDARIELAGSDGTRTV